MNQNGLSKIAALVVFELNLLIVFFFFFFFFEFLYLNIPIISKAYIKLEKFLGWQSGFRKA